MDHLPDSIFDEATEVAEWQAVPVKAMCLYAAEHKGDKRAMKEIRKAWGRDPKPFALAVNVKPDWFDGTTVSVYEYLSLIAICTLPKFARALLAAQWQDTTMSYSQVREAVDAAKERKSKATKEPKVCKYCGREQ